jgi:ribosomal protein S18 acetylase RimI-like enzyme
MISVGSYCSTHFEGVRALWEDVFPNDPPWNRAEVAIPEKLAVQPDLFLVAEERGEVIGTAMAGYDGHRGWLYTIAVKPDKQRAGVGSLLLTEAERRLNELGCGKINLQIRAGNETVVAFYRRHGYEIEDRIGMGKRVNSD